MDTIVTRLTNPNVVCAAEYRAIYETLNDALDSMDEDIRDDEDEQAQLALAVLVEFEATANGIRERLHYKVPHGRCPTCLHYGDDCTGILGRRT